MGEEAAQIPGPGTHLPPTPRLNASENKEARGDQRSREEEDKNGEKVGFQEAAALSPHVQGLVPGERPWEEHASQGRPARHRSPGSLYLPLIALEGNQEKRN